MVAQNLWTKLCRKIGEEMFIISSEKSPIKSVGRRHPYALVLGTVIYLTGYTFFEMRMQAANLHM